jgi:hypothetical protein
MVLALHRWGHVAAGELVLASGQPGVKSTHQDQNGLRQVVEITRSRKVLIAKRVGSRPILGRYRKSGRKRPLDKHVMAIDGRTILLLIHRMADLHFDDFGPVSCSEAVLTAKVILICPRHHFRDGVDGQGQSISKHRKCFLG